MEIMQFLQAYKHHIAEYQIQNIMFIRDFFKWTVANNPISCK